jgi:hypothetical protein
MIRPQQIPESKANAYNLLISPVPGIRDSLHEHHHDNRIFRERRHVIARALHIYLSHSKIVSLPP